MLRSLVGSEMCIRDRGPIGDNVDSRTDSTETGQTTPGIQWSSRDDGCDPNKVRSLSRTGRLWAQWQCDTQRILTGLGTVGSNDVYEFSRSRHCVNRQCRGRDTPYGAPPPHRSHRAALPHWAPTSGHGVEARADGRSKVCVCEHQVSMNPIRWKPPRGSKFPE